jgi:hypothetical protein
MTMEYSISKLNMSKTSMADTRDRPYLGAEFEDDGDVDVAKISINIGHVTIQIISNTFDQK